MDNSSGDSKLVVFDKKIRRVLHNGEAHFSIMDVIREFSGSANPHRYWSDCKIQLTQYEGFHQLGEKIIQLELEASDGKKTLNDTANTETIFRILQSIPSHKTEPFKRWLAKVGYESVQNSEQRTQGPQCLFG